MVVEIWSDVMCPFCYIGKRRYEEALKKFEHRETVTTVWRSFQLNPGLRTDASKSIHEYLSEAKGWSIDQALQMNAQVTLMAASSGLEYHLDKAIVANSFLAHRLSHLAKEYAVQNELEEELFAAYFTKGENTADEEILVQIGVKAGVPEEAIREMFTNSSKTDEVNQDIETAASIGISGVPFFVFDRKYAVSGAQESDTFLQVLNDVWEKEQAENN